MRKLPHHTLVVGKRGLRVFACGIGEHGQLGTGTHNDQRVPAPVAGLPADPTHVCIDMVAAAAGFHSAAITSAGEIFGAGTVRGLAGGDGGVRAIARSSSRRRACSLPLAVEGWASWASATGTTDSCLRWEGRASAGPGSRMQPLAFSTRGR